MNKKTRIQSIVPSNFLLIIFLVFLVILYYIFSNFEFFTERVNTFQQFSKITYFSTAVKNNKMTSGPKICQQKKYSLKHKNYLTEKRYRVFIEKYHVETYFVKI